MDEQTKVVFQVVGWNENFEGAKSRTYKNKSVCQMPTKHGLGYLKLVRQEDGPAMFGAWCSLIQILSRQPAPREGYCTDTGRIQGRPYTPEDLELLTDIPQQIFARLFQAASNGHIGWLSCHADTTRIPCGYHADTLVPLNSDLNLNLNSDLNSDLNPDSDSTARGYKGLTRAEKKKQRVKQNTDLMIRIGAWFGRQPFTRWSVAEVEALSEIEATDAEINGMEAYYTAKIPRDKDYRRRALSTLLNNWHTELDRARNFKPAIKDNQI